MAVLWQHGKGHGGTVQHSGVEHHSVLRTATDKVLAVVHAVKTWHHHVLGSRVVLYTDHMNLLSIKRSLTGRNGRLARWNGFLKEYDLDIRHVEGRTCCHRHAESPPRLCPERCVHSQR
jgi:hypothetical protein